VHLSARQVLAKLNPSKLWAHSLVILCLFLIVMKPLISMLWGESLSDFARLALGDVLMSLTDYKKECFLPARNKFS
jgi:hypothetical protein